MQAAGQVQNLDAVAAARENSAQYLFVADQRFVGRTMEVLVEGTARRDPSQLRGRIRHNKAVNFEGTAGTGELVEVEIASATSQTLTGHERLLSRV